MPRCCAHVAQAGKLTSIPKVPYPAFRDSGAATERQGPSVGQGSNAKISAKQGAILGPEHTSRGKQLGLPWTVWKIGLQASGG